MEIQNIELLKSLLVVEDFNGDKYWLHSADVCCGKALLISKKDYRLYVKPLSTLSFLC